MGKKIFLIDVAKCNGCYNCQLVCKDEHVGNDWSPYAKPQPEIGQFWLKLSEKTCGTIPKVRVHYTPRLCNHCDNAPCIASCPSGAAHRREDGLIIFDTEKCTGCKKCAGACPYEDVIWFGEAGVAQKCTGCAHLLDNGYELPRCVEACPTDAIRFGDEEELKEDLPGADVMEPEHGTHPRVFYRNLPGQFIAGTVYDPETEEVVIGARVRANTGGKFYETFTDAYGDFWFNDLRIGKFDVFVEAKGYEQKAFYDLRTTECINLGDIALTKAKK